MKIKHNSVSYFDMQFVTSSISTTLVLLLLGLVVFFVLGAHNLSVYVKENINFSILISDDMKESDILKLQKKLDKEPFVKATEYISKKQALREQHKHHVGTAAAGIGGVLCVGSPQSFCICKGEYQLFHSYQ